MNTIHNLKELNKVGTLRPRDNIIFSVKRTYNNVYFDSLSYIVMNTFSGTFLEVDGEFNNTIFNVLGENCLEFCEKAYGYTLRGGYFPYTKENDFEALTRVVKALYVSLGDTTNKEDVEETDRFSLMDLDW